MLIYERRKYVTKKILGNALFFVTQLIADEYVKMKMLKIKISKDHLLLNF